MLATIDRIREELGVGPGLLRRYRIDDGLPGGEGAFLLCCFELVSALVLAGRHDEAREVFDQLRGYAGPLDLYAEQLAPDGTTPVADRTWTGTRRRPAGGPPAGRRGRCVRC
ncbi:hypothetical protein E1193_23390 [Micromonospora sp. KC606]|nr:hypothetical protein E1193_23390 [Micromonospora sp. KC606]